MSYAMSKPSPSPKKVAAAANSSLTGSASLPVLPDVPQRPHTVHGAFRGKEVQLPTPGLSRKSAWDLNIPPERPESASCGAGSSSGGAGSSTCAAASSSSSSSVMLTEVPRTPSPPPRAVEASARPSTPSRPGSASVQLDPGLVKTTLTAIGDGPPKPAMSRWGQRAGGKGGGRAMSEQMLAAARREREAKARAEHRLLKRDANAAWSLGKLDECLEHLNGAIGLNGDCDVLHRYRANLHSREGRLDRALKDAGRAVEINPRASRNFHCHGRALEQSKLLPEAGAAYLAAMRFGLEGGSYEVGYAGLLHTVRREREFHSHLRPSWQKVLGNGVCRPSCFDPRKNYTGDHFAMSKASPPEPPVLRLTSSKASSFVVEWDDPDDGGDEIFLYVLQLSEYHVKWQADANGFFDDYLEYVTVHEGPRKVHLKECTGLRPGNTHRLRLRARNAAGDSAWSDELLVQLDKSGRGGLAEESVPRSWLTGDYSDLIAQQRRKDAEFGPQQFYAELASTLASVPPSKFKKIFKTYATIGVGQSSAKEMSNMQFVRFCKDMGLIEREPGLTGTTLPKTRLLGRPEIDLIFQRANMTELQSRGASKAAAAAAAGGGAGGAGGGGAGASSSKEDESLAVESLAATMGGIEDDGGDGDDDGGTSCMVIKEFVNALVRVAWTAYPGASGVGGKLGALFSVAIDGGYEAFLAQQQEGFDFEQVLQSRRVVAVLEHYEKDLLLIFSAYAQADQTGAGSLQALDSMNLAELMFVMKEGKMFDDNLTVLALTSIFATVNSTAEEEEEGDDDEQELCFDEFVQVVACVCNAKVPEGMRDGEPFEFTLQSWLHLVFIPTYKRILKDKARGIGSKTI